MKSGEKYNYLRMHPKCSFCNSTSKFYGDTSLDIRAYMCQKHFKIYRVPKYEIFSSSSVLYKYKDKTEIEGNYNA